MSRTRRRRVAAALAAFSFVVCLWLAVLTTGAAAHALLVRAEPATSATVTRSPARILLTFSEPVDPSLSSVRIVDAGGRPAPGVSGARAVPGSSYQLAVGLATSLGRGVYTVEWRTVSALDGHVAAGAYVFGVSVADVGTVAPFGKYASTARWLTTIAVAGRTSLYAGLVVLLGAAAVCLIALRGRLPAGGVLLLWLGWLLAAIGAATVTLSERAIVRAPSLLPLFETHEGFVLLGQCLFAIVVCGVAVGAVGLVARPATLAALGGAAAVTALVVIWASHADAPSVWRVLNLADQWLHVVAVGVWIGGLPWLLLGLRGLDADDRLAAVRRFSALATVALVVVLLTGMARAIPEVGSPANLVHTGFGVVLLVKLALVCALVAFGALNHFGTVPALGRDAGAVASLRRTVRAEIVLGLAVLTVTGLLGGLAPAAVAASAARAGASSRVVLAGADSATTVRVRLVVSPGTVGSNEFVATLTDLASGRALTGVRSVDLNLSLPARPAVPPSTVALVRAADGTWQASARAPSVAGRWSIAVTIERVNAVVVPLTLQVRLPAS
jgi:copper transport protein